MRLALISDIHGNLEALQTIIHQIHAMDVLTVFCLGDIVGYYPNPIECIHLIQDLCDTTNIVAGNHDQTLVSYDLQSRIKRFNPVAKKALLWTKEVLTSYPEELRFLQSLPITREVQIPDNPTKFQISHGTPSRVNVYIRYHEPDKKLLYERIFHMWFSRLTGIRVIALGHTHRSFIFQDNGRCVLNPGSVGQPRDFDPRASFMTVDIDDDQKISASLHRVEYDLKKTVQRVKEADLPDFLGYRLLQGR